MRRLTEHFSLEEMIATQQREFSNLPLPSIVANLYKTATFMEAIRELLDNKPIIVTSGYRSPQVNKAVGGSISSDHIQGLACDFICPGYGTPEEICNRILASPLSFDQLIHEITWVHIGIGHKMRHQFLDRSRKDWAVS